MLDQLLMGSSRNLEIFDGLGFVLWLVVGAFVAFGVFFGVFGVGDVNLGGVDAAFFLGAVVVAAVVAAAQNGPADGATRDRLSGQKP